jgi:hypothetical protein
MPTFDLTSPDGRTYSVEGPDGATSAQAFQILQQHLGSTPSSAPGYGEDIAKSLPADAAGLVSGTLGLPGDVSNLLAHGSAAASDFLAQKMGFDKGPSPAAPVLPTSGSIQQNIEGATGPLYQPQTGPGRMVQNAVNFAPAVLGGPETMVAKILSRVAAPAAAQEGARALTEGTAAQPYAEVAGALAGAGGASAVLSKLKAAQAARAGLSAIPESDALKAAARAQYHDPAVADVQIKQSAVSNLADTIVEDLQYGKNSGFRPSNEPKVFNAINELRTSPRTQDYIKSAATKVNDNIFSGINHAESTQAAASSKGMSLDDFIDHHTDAQVQQGFLTSSGRFVDRNEALKIARKIDQIQPNGPATEWWNEGRPGILLPGGLSTEVLKNTIMKSPSSVTDLDNIRQLLGGLAKEKDAVGMPTRQAAAALRAMGHIDDFIPNLKQPDLLAGNSLKANEVLQNARGNWGAAKRSEQVQTLLSNAEINAASANSGGNIQNTVKQAFKPLLKNNGAKAVGYNDAEMAALNKIVRGTWGGTVARAAGNLLGGGGGLGMLAGGAAGYEAGGVPGAIAAGVAGRVLKKIGNRSTLNAVQNLDNLIRSRAPEAVRLAAQNPQVAQALPPASIRALRMLILTDPALRSQNQQSSPVGQPYAQQTR